MGVALEVLRLPREARSYRFDELTLERLNKLSNRLAGKGETEIVRDALGHLLGSLERDQAVWMTAPSEVQKANPSGHKRPERDR